MSSVVTATPAGSPSRIATSAGPCDSPAVSQRNMAEVFHGSPRISRDLRCTSRKAAEPSSGCLGRSCRTSRSHARAADESEQHEGAERVALAVGRPATTASRPPPIPPSRKPAYRPSKNGAPARGSRAPCPSRPDRRTSPKPSPRGIDRTTARSRSRRRRASRGPTAGSGRGRHVVGEPCDDDQGGERSAYDGSDDAGSAAAGSASRCRPRRRRRPRDRPMPQAIGSKPSRQPTTAPDNGPRDAELQRQPRSAGQLGVRDLDSAALPDCGSDGARAVALGCTGSGPTRAGAVPAITQGPAAARTPVASAQPRCYRSADTSA